MGAPVEAATFVAFLEGPAVDAHGTVYFSDLRANRIMTLTADGELGIFREDAGRANGNVFDRQGRLVTCEGAEHGPRGRRRVTRTDIATGEVEVLADRYEGRRLNSPNDVTVDTQGRLYFTDPRYDADRSDLEMDVEGVYRIDPDGTVTRIIGQPDVERPNGLAVTPDDRVLYVIDSNHLMGGNRKVWAVALDADGNAVDRRAVYDFAPGRGGDGMELDVAGNLYVCAGILTQRLPTETTQNPPGVYVITPSGELVERIPIPTDVITNCCFGGSDKRTLYVTAGHMLYRTRVNVPGYHVHPDQGGP
ncbi:MAG: SMP-30/gluconolactonase/LRE family protein [bacterium]|nr:SMP-30/gluconolactonase/LRE family protein [bacterium]MCY3951457.1 SMP-30/gluconolactonase/LRE family protein [bacterium]